RRRAAGLPADALRLLPGQRLSEDEDLQEIAGVGRRRWRWDVRSLGRRRNGHRDAIDYHLGVSAARERNDGRSRRVQFREIFHRVRFQPDRRTLPGMQTYLSVALVLALVP